MGDDPSKPPGEGFEWRGKGSPESGKGNWVDTEKGHNLHPDLEHPSPKQPHWDFKGSEGEARLNLDGSWEWKT